MRIRLVCTFLLMFFAASVFGHSHSFDSVSKKSSAFVLIKNGNLNDTSSTQNSGCPENGFHVCGCVHSVVLKSLDFKIVSPVYFTESYLSYYAQLSEQEFIKKLKRPPKV